MYFIEATHVEKAGGSVIAAVDVVRADDDSSGDISPAMSAVSIGSNDVFSVASFGVGAASHSAAVKVMPPRAVKDAKDDTDDLIAQLSAAMSDMSGDAKVRATRKLMPLLDLGTAKEFTNR